MTTATTLSSDYLVNSSDKIIPVSDVISISLVENRLNFISRACRLLHTESFDTDDTAKTVFNTYASIFESNLSEEAVYRGNNCIARLKFVYGISLFQNDEQAILMLTNRYGGTLISESAKPDTLDEAFQELATTLGGRAYEAMHFRWLHANCLLSSRLLPMVEKTPNGVVIKVNDNFVSFVATKDDALKEQLFAEIRTALA
ncbi:hypothetical protein LAW27_06615 [Escherichia coli]|uniref:hypothetical protein n=1 Tax=Enterobacteriaceae TaxID=543 RepID=UPI00111A29AA|nr:MULTISPECIES: hypothetical protein [Enterobacteriaceae]EFC2636672.1 hypothetical protein [Escherichia coli]MCB4495996.1 hypothetical protein [Escherichia coli]MDD8260922.1 hypothetical protein [Escherichia coli]QCZ25605.1 hypothetical protein FHN83_02585 [Leclercia adecarboxylata]HAW2807183.1 hypothetical protein [Escherichia coli]